MTEIQLVHVDTLSCETILREFSDGTLIIVSQCGDVREPAPGNRVYAFISGDGGKSWTKPTAVYPEDGRAVYCTEVYVTGQTARCWLNLHNGRFLDFETVTVISLDGGKTWETEGRLAGFDDFVFARGVLEVRGNIVQAFQSYPGTAAKNASLALRDNSYIWHSDIPYCECGVRLSRDGGKTFVRGGAVHIPLKNEEGAACWQWPEPTLAYLGGEKLVMLLRFNGAGVLLRSDSDDGGMSWRPPYRTGIPNPGNKPKLTQTSPENIALIHTPNGKQGYRARNPLSVWISRDKMQSWYYQKELVNFPGWLSYPDGVFSADHKYILFAFEFNRHDIYFVRHEIEV